VKPIILPIIPNAPISKNDKTLEAEFCLKSFGDFRFIQNVLFDSDLINFNENYQNNQSNSDSFQKHMSEVYSIIKSKFPKDSKLIEVGCGKGAFLEIVKADGHFNYVGYDTAYEGNDEKIKARYVNESDKANADIVVMRHSLDYIKAPHTFLKMLGEIFGENALIFIEVPQFDWIHEHKVLFDFAYERPSYFSTESLCSLFTDVEEYGNLFGGQYQYCFASLGDVNSSKWSGFESDDNWSDFNFDEYKLRFKEKTKFLDTKSRVWIWGGATKGVLFLKHLLDVSPLNFRKVVAVVDVNPKKQSLFTPSTNLAIISPKEMYSKLNDGDFILVMNPNYLEEVRSNLFNNTSLTVNVGCF
jgi:hypothetical protein